MLQLRRLHFSLLAPGVVLFIISQTPSIAGTTVLSTGRTSAGITIAERGIDPRWTVAMPNGGISATRTLAPNPRWFNPGSRSAWIAPASAQSGETPLPSGSYVYRTQFPTPAGLIYALLARINTDNALVAVRLNDRPITLTGSANFRIDFPVALTVTDQAMFTKQGMNTLEVEVRNSPGETGNDNPTGLVVQGTLVEISNNQAMRLPASFYCWVTSVEQTSTPPDVNQQVSAWENTIRPSSRTWGSDRYFHESRGLLAGGPLLIPSAAAGHGQGTSVAKETQSFLLRFYSCMRTSVQNSSKKDYEQKPLIEWLDATMSRIKKIQKQAPK